MKYAAFIITYNRPVILLDTIQKIFSQTLPPEKILIVDNNIDDITFQAIEDLSNPAIEYYRVGYNSGPSGGAYHGLQILGEDIYDWILWIDDDNPPSQPDTIEKIFSILNNVKIENCGQIGLVGNTFNKWTGELKRLSNEELKNNELIEVDFIGGGQCKIISSKVARLGILPEKKLFFGFEELDLDIKIKKAGFKSYVSGDLLYESRKNSNRLHWNKSSNVLVDKNNLGRHYYSIRSLLYVYSKNNYWTALIYFTIKKIVTIILSFKQGWGTGKKYSKIVVLAYFHFLNNKFGKVDLDV